MTKVLLFFKRIPAFFFLSLLSGVLVGTSYIPFPGWALFFCYVPLWLAALKLSEGEKPLLRIFFAGWLTQFVFTLIGFNWIFYVATEFGHLHWSLALTTLLLFAAAMHLYVPVALAAGVLIIRYFRIGRKLPQLLVLALTLALLERIWPSIFEWNLAYTLLWTKWPLFQWADTVGFWGLSTWILLLQAPLAAAVAGYKNSPRSALALAGGVLALILMLNITGHFHARRWQRTDAQVRIAVAQGNIGNAEKIQSEKRYQYHSYIRSVYTTLTAAHLSEPGAGGKADLVIWPETAVPFALDENYHARFEQSSLLATVQDWGIPVVTGGYSVSADRTDHLGYALTRNAVFYLSPERGFADRPYYKTNLLAFGEYMPFGEELPVLYKLLPFVGVYEKGSGPVVARVTVRPADGPAAELRLGPQICYDSLVPGFTRGLADNGAQILFNVTNDSWFGWWAEPFQHGWMTLARAVEVRRPLVRSTNTGISTAILADGRVLERSPLGQTWTHTFDIPYRKNPPATFYSRFGHWDWILWTLALLGIILFSGRKTPPKGSHV